LIAARKHFPALALAAALAACSTGDPLTNDLLTQSIAAGAPRKSVCAISGIGDTFSLQKVGATVFGNALDKAPIDAWGIDEFLTNKIGAQLSRRFDVKRISAPKGAFAEIERVKSPFSADAKDYRLEIKDIARGIVGSQKCDLVVAVTKSGSQFSSTNQAVFGLGIVDGSNFVFTSVWLFGITEIRVYDGQTFAILGHKRSYTWQPSLVGVVIRGPSRQVDKTWWPASPAHVASDARLKQATMELLEQSMATMIADLFPEGQASAKR
jgi:hypothetical protein